MRLLVGWERKGRAQRPDQSAHLLKKASAICLERRAQTAIFWVVGVRRGANEDSGSFSGILIDIKIISLLNSIHRSGEKSPVVE